MSKKNKLIPDANNPFNTEDEKVLRERFENGEMNHFHSRILEKVYENYPTFERDKWEKLMDMLEKLMDTPRVKEQIDIAPITNKALSLAIILYLILTEILPFV